MVEKEYINGKAPFSDAVKVGNMIMVSGQVPKDPIKGGWAEDMDGQTTQCLENIKRILEQAGGKISDIIRVTVFISDVNKFGTMNHAYIKFFKKNGVEKNFPARTTVEVGKGKYREWKIEIDCVAMI
jgi:2-iminobutanoate/2-iminopropanoate deaminase